MRVSKNTGVLFFSLEMDVDELELRMLCIESRIQMDVIETGIFTEEESARFVEAEKSLTQRKMRIIDEALSLQEIVTEVRREYMKGGLGLVVVDYLQLVRVDSKQDRHLQVAEISRTLKLLAKKIKTPILALAQLNRLAEGQEPELHHLRESGAIEQDANMVWFLYKPQNDINPNLMNVAVAKNRQGRTGKREIYYDREIQSFYAIA
jgi:replicative DNA helicase